MLLTLFFHPLVKRSHSLVPSNIAKFGNLWPAQFCEFHQRMHSTITHVITNIMQISVRQCAPHARQEQPASDSSVLTSMGSTALLDRTSSNFLSKGSVSNPHPKLVRITIVIVVVTISVRLGVVTLSARANAIAPRSPEKTITNNIFLGIFFLLHMLAHVPSTKMWTNRATAQRVNAIKMSQPFQRNAKSDLK